MHPRRPGLVFRLSPAVVVLCGSLLFLLAACEKGAADLANEGNYALVQNDYDGAIKNFNDALAKDPENAEAIMGLAEAYAKKKDYPKSLEFFDKAKQKIKEDDPRRQYLDEKLQELYLSQAEGLKDKDPNEYEAMLRKVIEVRDRGSQANSAYFDLGELYMSRGETLAKDKATRKEAIVLFEKMKSIKTEPAKRKKALKEAERLYREIHKDDFAKELAGLKPELVKNELFDEATKRLKVKATIEDAALNPRTDEEKAEIRGKLQSQATAGLITMTYKLTGRSVPERIPNSFKFASAKVEAETIERGKAELIVSVTTEELEQLSYDVIVKPARQKAASAKDGDKADKGAEKTAPKAGNTTADAGASDKASSDAGTEAADDAATD